MRRDGIDHHDHDHHLFSSLLSLSPCHRKSLFRLVVVVIFGGGGGNKQTNK